MTRIIAGSAGSLTLAVPDAGTRPTSERVRESLFGALEAADLLSGAVVADLYAGSGALGLEAASRGAREVDLIEHAPRAARVIDRNVTAVARAVGAATIRVHRSTADAYLRSATVPLDLVFLDPPYDLPATELASTLELLVPRLRPGATVIVERATRSGAPSFPPGISAGREKRYGDTTVWWGHADGAPNDDVSR